ncbi:hypothetical protein [Streptomyces sp. NPDC056670]|uniref:hypothetical protein n=1 Tax=Streptomyces sp. NPDC056670 TaxID=3345904 RepID=UPI00368F090C
MSESAPEAVGVTPTVPTPAEAVASGQIPAQAVPAQLPAAPAPNATEAAPEEPDWEAEAAKWKAMARKHEKGQLSALGFKSMDDLAALKEAAQKYQDAQDAQKSEIQRANERAQTYEQQLADMRAQNARLLAAATHNIPADLIDLLGAGTDEEIAARAEVLAERLKAAQPAVNPAMQRPVEALTPGAAPASSSAAVTPDQWIRRLSGRTP